MVEKIDLSSWAKESTRRGETIEIYLVKEGKEQQEIVQIYINPQFLAGLLKVGILTNYCLIKARTV